ncbi:clan AA aspartic protease [Pedobacter sp. HMF7647]|uniref:Clan AA aspartic protease n=1 Tax=Hufsiella arboris TaxID=2695275 RepID=A0A7K1YFF2_9SPHI|nr:aspartyl protease family protein [Hufsiella arboris]MXV53121.1 clan AA aspartic protease [Hufsiella arboris]
MTEIPLQILNLQDDGFHLLLDITAFGQTFKTVLDTGASRTVLDKSMVSMLVQEHLLLSTDRLSTGLGTNEMESFKVTIPNFHIGALIIPDFEAAVIDLSAINYAYQKLDLDPVLGVIGGDLLMKYGAVINYTNLSLKLFTD